MCGPGSDSDIIFGPASHLGWTYSSWSKHFDHEKNPYQYFQNSPRKFSVIGVAIGKPEWHARKTSRCGSKQQ